MIPAPGKHPESTWKNPENTWKAHVMRPATEAAPCGCWGCWGRLGTGTTGSRVLVAWHAPHAKALSNQFPSLQRPANQFPSLQRLWTSLEIEMVCGKCSGHLIAGMAEPPPDVWNLPDGLNCSTTQTCDLCELYTCPTQWQAMATLVKAATATAGLAGLAGKG